MNEKVTLPALIQLLAADTGDTRRESEDFIKEFFSVVSSALSEGEQVKIKDFGVFKTISVGSRKSVNVSTGEGNEIPAHKKVVFVPSKEIASAINEPFEMFESVEVEDGVSLDVDSTEPFYEEEEKTVADDTAGVSENPVDEDLQADDIKKDAEDRLTADKDGDDVDSDKELSTICAGGSVTDRSSVDTEVEPEYDLTDDVSEYVIEDEMLDTEFSSSTLEVDDDPKRTGRADNSREAIPQEVNTDTVSAGSAKMISDRKVDLPEQSEYDEQSESDEEIADEEEDREGKSRKKGGRFMYGFFSGLLAAAVIGGIIFVTVKYLDLSHFTSKERVALSDTLRQDSEEKDTTFSDNVDSTGVLVSESGSDGRDNGETSLVESKENIKTDEDNAAKKEKDEEAPTQPSDKKVYDTISKTRYLTTMAKEHYGNFHLWPYIYMENKAFLGHPDRIKPGTKVVIPPLSKYGVDPNNPKDIAKAKQKGVEIYSRYK